MTIFNHKCPMCGYKSEDPHKLVCCPDCSSNTITNTIPVTDFPEPEIYGENWNFLDTDPRIKEAYYQSYPDFSKEDIDLDWQDFLGRKCVVCGNLKPNLINLFSPSIEFSKKYLHTTEETHRIVFTRLCTPCSKHPDFIEALKNKLIEMYKGYN